MDAAEIGMLPIGGIGWLIETGVSDITRKRLHLRYGIRLRRFGYREPFPFGPLGECPFVQAGLNNLM
jgi:hypothetical protein